MIDDILRSNRRLVVGGKIPGDEIKLIPYLRRDLITEGRLDHISRASLINPNLRWSYSDSVVEKSEWIFLRNFENIITGTNPGGTEEIGIDSPASSYLAKLRVVDAVQSIAAHHPEEIKLEFLKAGNRKSDGKILLFGKYYLRNGRS